MDKRPLIQTSKDVATLPLKKFVSEEELEEIRKLKQAEWDKVRKPDDPTDLPEPEICPKSLYERLKEQRDKIEAEWEEKKKYKNQIRGVNDDELLFLDNLNSERRKRERDIEWEERGEIEEFRMNLQMGPSVPGQDPITKLDALLKPIGPYPKLHKDSSDTSSSKNTGINLKSLVKTGGLIVKKPATNKTNNIKNDDHFKNDTGQNNQADTKPLSNSKPQIIKSYPSALIDSGIVLPSISITNTPNALISLANYQQGDGSPNNDSTSDTDTDSSDPISDQAADQIRDIKQLIDLKNKYNEQNTNYDE